ncbi:carbohydrate-binding module family 1 protein, partial [Piromyces sp. E2]
MKFSVCASIISLTLFKYANAACAGPYAQCGGNNFSGEACCESGYKCVAINEWYSQCQEDATSTQSSTQNNAASDNANNNEYQWNNDNNNYQWDNNNNNYQWNNENVNQWNNENVNQWNVSTNDKNFFLNEIYANPRFIEEIDSSIPKLTPELQAKAEKVKDVPTAVWLAWDGAPGEVEGHLVAAGSKTVVFLLYMIPTRDCNSNASAGGASDLNKYKGYIDDISNTIKSHPESKVVMVVEPDTLGNLVTGSSEACKNVHTLHKNALSYAVDVFGAMDNVSVYLDAAHGMWLGSHTDKVATVVKEILDNAPHGKIRGLSTNVSNYQPVYSEYQYHEKLAASLAAVGVNDIHFIVDTGRDGVDVTETFSKQQTWCNFIGAGLGPRPQGNPDASMPLLDAYMWLKTPGEADGSAVG